MGYCADKLGIVAKVETVVVLVNIPEAPLTYAAVVYPNMSPNISALPERPYGVKDLEIN